MCRTVRCRSLRGERPKSRMVLSVLFWVLGSCLLTSGQSEKIPPDSQQIVALPSVTTTPVLTVTDKRVNDLASRIAEASTEEAADAALAAAPEVTRNGLGRALLFEIIRRRNNNESAEKILTVALRFLRYAKRPEMSADRALAHRGAGLAYANLESWGLAESELQTAIAMFRRAGSEGRQDAVWTSRDLAVLFSRRGYNLRAREYLEKSRVLADAIGDKESSIHICNSLAILHYQAGDFATGDAYSETSLKLLKEIKDNSLTSTTLAQFASAFLIQGRINKSIEAYDGAYRAAGESSLPSRLNYLYQSAIAQIKMGDLSSAYSRLRKVEAESVATQDRRLHIYSLISMAWIHKQHGQEKKAVELYERTVTLAESEISKSPESGLRVYMPAKAEAFNRLAEIHTEKGEAQTAIDLYTRNLKMVQSAKASLGIEVRDRPNSSDSTVSLQIGINRSLGDLHSSLGNTGAASAHFAAALDLAEKTWSQSGLIDTLLSMATHEARNGDPQRALSYVGRVDQMVPKDGRSLQILKLRTITANIQRKLNRPVAADLIFQDAIRISESLRTDVLMPDQRASYFSIFSAPFDEYIDFLMDRHKEEPDAGFDGRAFNISERRRARALLDSLKAARADIRQGVDAGLLEQENRVRHQLNALAREQFSTMELQFSPVNENDAIAGRTAPSKSDVSLLTAELTRVETAIRKQSPRYAELMQPRPLRWGGIQTLLDEKTILLNYTLGAKRSFLWTITQNGVKSFILPSRSEIESLVKTAYGGLSETPNEAGTDESVTQAAKSLSSILLEPALESIGDKRIVIVADGALQYLPFSSLPDPRTNATSKTPILLSNEIQFAPSGSVVAVLRQEAERRPAPPRSVAIFADPVFSANDERFDGSATSRPTGKRAIEENSVSRSLFDSRILIGKNGTTDTFDIPRLPFSRREAEAIFSSAPPHSSFIALDFEASRERVEGADLSKYGIVHFATHGILHSEHPELSGVVLSLFNEKSQPVDGFLRLHDIYNMKLNADLVVLSACQTALGKEVRGEGLIGLTRGFMYAGSPRVLASLWKVDDVATAELMKIFYQKMLKENMPPAAALRAAKIEMMKHKRWSSPYYWAAFELQGEWR